MGLHRAGSTSLQAWLARETPRLEHAGCFAATAQEGSIFNLLAGQTFAQADAAAVAGIIAEDLRERGKQFSRGFLSDENLLGAMPRRGVPAFAAAEKLGRVLKLLSADHEIVPVIILREHVAWMSSLYRVAQFRCETASFADFSKGLVAEPTPFAALVTVFAVALAPARPIVTSLEAIAADGGQAFLAQLDQSLGIGRGMPTPLPRVNAAQNPLFCELRQKVARRGGFLVFEGCPEMMRQANRLWHHPKDRNPETMAKLSAAIVKHSVRVPDRLRFSERLAAAQKLLAAEGGAPPWLSLDKAHEALTVALRAAHQPLLPATEAARHREVFASDRQWLKINFPEARLDPTDNP